MAKGVSAAVLDLALNQLKNNSNKQTVCSAQPTTYAEANATFMLANVAMAAGDYTLAAGDTSGRKVTMSAKNGIAVTNSGTATHIAIINTTATTLDLWTTCTSQAINTGGTVDIPAWKYEINLPT
jgi:hypothetical protein